MSFNDDDSDTPFGFSVFDESWDNLEEEQREAAVALGYEEASWPKIVKVGGHTAP